MHPTSTSNPASASSGPAPSPSASTPPPKRRHRVDSNPAASWSQSSLAPDSKRPRPTPSEPTMLSAKSQGKRPVEVIDLTGSGASSQGSVTTPTYRNNGPNGTMTMTSRGPATKRPSAFQPHSGAKKLVIKNLRVSTPTRSASVEDYYSRTWRELDDALTAVFAGRQPAQPLEKLYRGVEDICRKGEAEKLGEMLQARCEEYLGKEVLARIRSDGGGPNADSVVMLRAVLAHWKRWSQQLTLIRSMFSWLDRSFLISSRKLPQINDGGISIFRRMVFVARKDAQDQWTPGLQVLEGMCKLVDFDRRGDDRFDSTLLKESVTMLNVFGVYTKSFEPMFLRKSAAYFEEFAEERSVSSSLKDYIAACERLLKREDFRCAAYNFDSTTKRQLMDSAHHILIEKYSTKLLDGGSVAKLLDDNEVESMQALYELLRLSGIQKRLRQPWESYIRQSGSAIVTDKEKGDDMIIKLLELRKKLDIMIRDAFAKDEEFTWGLREAFGGFINDRSNASVWGTGTSKVGEMIAKYIDVLLRGGLKTLPKSLLSDIKDRADDEMSGLASTGDEDAELDRQLDHALELFRFIQGKDVFEAFYKRDLARRLLMSRSASQDAERNMLTKLKSECGSSFTHNLEQMFKDQELGRDEMIAYKQWKEGTGSGKNDIDLTVSVLSAAAWPTYPDVKVLLPPEVLDHIEHFDRFYKNKHTGRRLTWKHNLAHCVIKAKFERGTKELLVSAFQAVVLVLFNQATSPDGVLSYEQISHATGLTGSALERTLQSLACGKVRVLTKAPKGRDVKPTDTFAVNRAFTDPKYRVKINQIQLKETKEENQETHQRVAADRQFETQAAIVRIMKSRKTMTHAQLVSEVIEQTVVRGAVDPAEIKKNIEKLIEKDYLEREGGSYTYLA
ncbi:putative nuclear pore complex subunit Nup192 [Coniochaeta sp. PMI_546]|nr:putative nuclear pore complex subunit Nup192 [Coniochaeta sp. PMI_546]